MCKKYVLVEGPESEIGKGHPDCIIAKDSSCFVPEDLFIEWKAMNKNVTELESMHVQYKFLENMLRESVRKYLSRILMNTSVENPLKTKICLVNSEAFGLSSLNFPWIYYMYQDLTEGIIYFGFDETDSEPVEFDAMLLEDLITICKELDK